MAGVPGRVRRTLEGSAAEFVRRSSAHYVDLPGLPGPGIMGSGARCGAHVEDSVRL